MNEYDNVLTQNAIYVLVEQVEIVIEFPSRSIKKKYSSLTGSVPAGEDWISSSLFSGREYLTVAY